MKIFQINLFNNYYLEDFRILNIDQIMNIIRNDLLKNISLRHKKVNH